MKGIPTLDVDWLRAFVSAADTRSFTAAGAALAATQSTISVRIRKLEERLNHRLMERNPRSVILTPAGAHFLDDARRVLQIHDDAALRAMGAHERRSFEIGVSDHAAGQLLPLILASLHREKPHTQMLVTVGTSGELFAAYERGRFDAVIGRCDDVGADGQIVLVDKLAWIASKTFSWNARDPLPFVSLAAPCSIRDIAMLVLGSHGIAWRSAFVGMGVAAIQAAVSAGLGIACLETRNIPAGCRQLGTRSGLPPLPRTQIVMRTRHRTPGEEVISATIVAALKKAASEGKGGAGT
jgi:DNA-binding transcriptional LysR family regulator